MQPEPAYITSNGYKLMYQPKIDQAKARIREVGLEMSDENIVRFYTMLGGWLISPNGEKVDTLAYLQQKEVAVSAPKKEEKEEVVINNPDEIIDENKEITEQVYATEKPRRGRPFKDSR